MRIFGKILLVAVSVAILTLSVALAGSKFKNEDTAADRRDNAFGTDKSEETASQVFGKTETGDTAVKTKARPKPDEVDWYEKIIISVNPNTDWPQSSSTTTTEVEYDNATDTETTTTTTTTKE